MKKLVIYYSLEGNTKLMAESISEATGADILELKLKKEISSKGVMKFFWGGKAALMKEKPELLPLIKDVESYDLLFIGTPVWAWTYSPPLNTFFSMKNLSNKKIALFCCHGGGKGKVFEKMKQALMENEILGNIDFQDPLRKNTEEHVQRAKDWAKEIAEKDISA